MNEPLYAVLPALPTSVNNLYRPGGMRNSKIILTDEGKAYKNAAVKELRKAWRSKIHRYDRQAPYKFVMVAYLHLRTLFTVTKKAKNPIKQLDADNFLKVVLDAVTKFTQIDDRCYFDERVIKQPIPDHEEERTEIWIFPLNGLQLVPEGLTGGEDG